MTNETVVSPPVWIRRDEAARLSNLSASMIKKLVRGRKFKTSKPGKVLLIDRESFLKFLESCATPAV